jgi:hypothetical protein
MRSRSTRLALSLFVLTLPLSASAQIINGSLKATDYTWTGSNSVFGMFGTIVELLIGIASVLAAIFFMYAGFLYLTSAGDTAKINQAHKIFKDVGWGFVLLLSAWLIVVSILQALEAQSWLLRFFGVGN